MKPVIINLALQGGGAHGAFTWGVLDRLLEETWIEIDGITATSAGAMNAAALKAGWITDGNKGARASLAAFWEKIGGIPDNMPEPFKEWLTAMSPPLSFMTRIGELNPANAMADMLSRTFSPYDTNPLNHHPLRATVDDFFDFDAVCRPDGPKLFICATNVRSGKVKIFSETEISTDAVLASACLPTLYRAIEIKDPKTGEMEAYWDGGYMGNPALFPLFNHTNTTDVLLVHINPIRREEIPRTAREIENRINEISFNSSLLRELRNIEFVQRLLTTHKLEPGEMKDIRIHQVSDDETMTKLGVSTKRTPTLGLLTQLRDAGRVAMDKFLDEHADKLGQTGTVDLRAMFD